MPPEPGERWSSTATTRLPCCGVSSGDVSRRDPRRRARRGSGTRTAAGREPRRRTMRRNDRHLTLDELRARIDDGRVDTVIVAFTDMQGRLQGKRLHGEYFLDVAVAHGTEGCNYLLG